MNSTFYDDLAQAISKMLTQSDDPAAKGFWCDGILESEHAGAYSSKYINDHRQVALKAFCGNNGQDEYELTLRFGPQSLSRQARELDLTVCIPQDDYENYFAIDTTNRTMRLQLL